MADLEIWVRGRLSFKVIENSTIRKLGYDFLFAFHSNWLHLVSCPRKSEILIKNRLFSYHPAFDAPVREVPVGM